MFRTTIRGILMFAGLVGIAGGVMVWYAWVRGDEYAREELHRRLAEIAPACELRFGLVRFDWQEALTVSDFSLGAKVPGAAPTLTVPEAILEIDRNRFLNDQSVEVKVIKFLRPRFEVTRRLDGSWSTDDLFPFHATDIQVPEWRIEDATIVFRIEQPHSEPVALTLEHADLQLEPTGRRQYSINCSSSVADAGPLQVKGILDLDTGTWSLAGKINGVTTSGNIADFALRSSKGLRGQVADLERKLQDAKESIQPEGSASPAIGANIGPYRTVSRTNERVDASQEIRTFDDDSVFVMANGIDGRGAVAESEERSSFGDLGVTATVDLQFSAGRKRSEDPLDYQVDLICRDGELTNPLLPFPLKRLRGRLDLRRDSLTLKSFEADAGPTSLKVEGTLSQGDGTAHGSFTLSVSNFILNDQPDGRLPAAVEKLIEILHPSGPIDLSTTIRRGSDSGWKVDALELTAKGAAISAAPFPYPVRDIVGRLWQEHPGRYMVEMVGKAGTRPVRLDGFVNDAGEASEVFMHISGDQIPLDETFLHACPPTVQELLSDLRLAGTARDLEIQIARPAGLDQRYTWGFKGRLEQGEIEYAQFPFRLTGITGDVSYDSLQETLSIWNAVGQHNGASVAARGTYRQIPEVGPDGASPIVDHRPGLDLELSAKQVSLDGDLREALPSGMKVVWDDLRPAGIADSEVKVTWLPGYQADIELTSFSITKGSIKSRLLPYTLESVIAKGSFVPWRSRVESGQLKTLPARLNFDEMIGWHPNGAVRIDASGSALELDYRGGWDFTAPRFVAEDIQFGSEFRRAVPEGLRTLIDTLNPRGRFLVEGTLDLAQQRETRQIDADWDLVISTRAVPATVNAGVELTDVVGQVRSRGSHRNGATEGVGTVNLERAVVLGQKLTRVAGPLRFTDARVEIGSVEVARQSQTSSQEPDVPIEKRLSGNYLDGLLTFDSILLLEDEPRYAGRLVLTAGSLERYAVTQSTGPPPNLAGVMTGWLNFTGQGKSANGLRGQGRLDISPAALYELPVIMKMFKALVLVPPDGPAFSSAQLIFSVHDSAVFFDPREGGLIDLAGDTLRLRGGGRVGFDRNLDLEFYSSLPRSSTQAVQAVPVVGPLVGAAVQAATTGWVSVVVRGPADDPFVNTVPLKVLPDTWRLLFEPRGGRIPARNAIGLGPRR